MSLFKFGSCCTTNVVVPVFTDFSKSVADVLNKCTSSSRNSQATPERKREQKESDFARNIDGNWVLYPFCRDFAFAFALVWLDHKCTQYGLHVATEKYAPSIFFCFSIRFKADKKSANDFLK